MKICYLGNASSVHMERWAGYFAQKGHEVTVITDVPGDIRGVQVINIGDCLPPFQIKLVSATVQILRKVQTIRRILKEIRPDVFHAHYATNYGFLASLSGYHPLVVTVHGSDVLIDYEQNLVSRWFVRRALETADVVTSAAPQLTAKIQGEENRAKRIYTFQYGVDTERFFWVSGDAKQNPQTVISTRHLGAKYEVKSLIEAIPEVLKDFPETRFVIVGDGPERSRLEREARFLGVAERASFLGQIESENMPEILHRASIYVSTSPTDGLSISLLEAMACGLFPIVTDIPGNRPLIQNGENGLLFPVGDSRSLAEKICLVCKDLSPSNPYSLEINRRLIEEKWSQKRAMDRMETIYSSLLRL